jgi:hypothetical protein
MEAVWRRADASHGSYVVGMLGLEERKLLYHLARDIYAGEGAVVDVGSFCGASTCCLAAGLRDNPRSPHGKVLHAFDIFIADHPYLSEFIHEHMGRSLSVGESFRPIFDDNVSPFADLIEVHEGNLREAAWPQSSPIEILFIDAAKDLRLSAKILSLFFPRLIPGRSIIIHQDFHHPATFFLVVVMEFLREHFEVIEEMVDYSAAWRLVSPIPSAKLGLAGQYAFSFAEQLAAIWRTARSFRPEHRHNLRLAMATLIGARFGKRAFDLAVFSVSLMRHPREDIVWAQNLALLRSFDAEVIERFNRATLLRR